MTRSKQIRIVYVNDTGFVGGSGKVLVNMVRGLDRARYEPYVLCPAEGDLAAMIKTEDAACVPVPPVIACFTRRPTELWKTFKSLLKVVLAVRRRLSWLNPDLVHANTLRAGIVASLASAGTGRIVIWQVHDILPRHPLSTAIRLFAWLLHRTHIVAVSQKTGNSFRGPLPFGNRVHLIHNGTNPAQFAPQRSGSAEFRRKLGIPEDSFLICAVGEVCARKELLELIEAFERIDGSAPQMHLAIAGKVVLVQDERDFESVLRAVADPEISNRVHFIGKAGDVSTLLQAADLLVLNSKQDPSDLVLVDANFSGAPVLAKQVGEVSEIIGDNENRWLIDKDDVAGLSKKLVEFSQNKSQLEKIAQAAHYEICPQFSLVRFQSRLHSLYADLVPKDEMINHRAHSASPCH